ncbi:hypothetical protein SEPCBS57363_004658 [Sporothrix epigloea]|uniref:J domain-containing protein n=1 Tax=Sporothrix epigloea TaxID=1892477 RepID=A0ABP0DTJ3_9PEZI
MAPSVGGKDHYAILEVPMTADDATVAASYRRLARLKHPDKNRTNPNATAEFQALQEAYTVLKDYKARAEYDCRIHFKKKATGAGASRARATTARTAGASSGASATMAATAAAVEMLRQKRKQTRQENSAASVAGIFSFHVHTGNLKASAHVREKTKAKAKEETREKRSTEQQKPPRETTPRSNHIQQGIPVTDYSDYEVGTMYPPPPTDLPQWPDRPPGRDHALEKQIRQVRSDIRTEEKTIRRLNRGVDKKEEEIGTMWEAVRSLDDELANAADARAKMEEKIVEQEWHNALFGDQAAATADSSMPKLLSPKSAERIKQAERAYKSLQKKVARAYEAIESSMTASRLLVDQIEKAYMEKTAKEAILHELGRRWRVHEFGVDSVEGEGGDLAGTWDGWCGWGEGEGETGLGTDDKNDGTEDGSERHNDGEDGAASAAWGQWQTEPANWWNGGSETVYADPSHDEWSRGSKDGMPLTTHDTVDSISQGLENVFFDTQVDESQHGYADVRAGLGQSLDGMYYQYQDVHGPYEHYRQYGHNSTPHEQVTGDDTTYHEPSNGEDSTGGGVALSNGSLGKGEQAQRDWQRQKDAELIAFESEVDEQESDKSDTADAARPRATKSTASTDRIADPLQTITTTTTTDTSPMNAGKDNQDRGSDKGEREGQLHGWLNASGVDMLGQGSWAPVASTNVWKTATSTGLGTVAATSSWITPSMSLPPRPPASHRQGIVSPIATLAGSAAATQAWWPGEELYYEAEQAGGDAREMAWRHAQWHEW